MTANEFEENVRNYIGKEVFCFSDCYYNTVVHGKICGFTVKVNIQDFYLLVITEKAIGFPWGSFVKVPMWLA